MVKTGPAWIPKNPRPSNFIRLMLADPEELKGGETWGSFLSQQCSSVADGTRAGTGYSKYNPWPPMAKTRWCQPELDLLRGLWGGHDMMTPLMSLIRWCLWCHWSQKCSMRSYWKPASCHWFCQQLRALKRRHLCSLPLAVRLKFPYITKHFTLILMLHSFVTNISTIQDIQVWINFPIWCS